MLSVDIVKEDVLFARSRINDDEKMFCEYRNIDHKFVVYACKKGGDPLTETNRVLSVPLQEDTGPYSTLLMCSKNPHQTYQAFIKHTIVLLLLQGFRKPKFGKRVMWAFKNREEVIMYGNSVSYEKILAALHDIKQMSLGQYTLKTREAVTSMLEELLQHHEPSSPTIESSNAARVIAKLKDRSIMFGTWERSYIKEACYLEEILEHLGWVTATVYASDIMGVRLVEHKTYDGPEYFISLAIMAPYFKEWEYSDAKTVVMDAGGFYEHLIPVYHPINSCTLSCITVKRVQKDTGETQRDTVGII